MESRKPPLKDYYAVLGVAPDATATQIKKAYRALAHRYHPDRLPSDEDAQAAGERMVEINEAFAVVSDKKKRDAYDQQRTAPKKPAPAAAEAAPGEWQMPEQPTPTPAATPRNPMVDQSVSQDFLYKLKALITQQGASANLKEEPEKPWLWSFQGKTWGGSYSVSLRLCPTLNPNVARDSMTHVASLVAKRRSGWKSNFFLFILAFQTLSEAETVLKLLRAFCGREDYSTTRNLVNVVVMDLNSRRSVLCGKRTHDKNIDPILSALAIG